MKQSNINKPAALALALCAIFAPSVHALEMGKIVIYSHLSEPLNAAILLGAADGRSLSQVHAKAASLATYEAAGLKRPAWLDDASVVATMIDKGRIELRITTTMPVETPAASLLIEVTIDGDLGGISREYAVILDPAEKVAAPALPDLKPLKGAGMVPRAPSSTAATAATAPAQAASVAKSGPASGEIVVRSGQILYAIAQSRKPEGVSIERMMIGVLRANPSAFVSDNINRLKAGAILRMPERPELEAIKQADAVSQVNAQASEFQQWRARTVPAVSRIDSAKTSQSAGGKIAPVATAPDPKDVLRLGKPEDKGSKSGDRVDAISNKKALEEANDRIKSLEAMRDDLKKLLTLRDKELAAAQAKAAASVKPVVGAPGVAAPALTPAPTTAPTPAPTTAPTPAPTTAPTPAPTAAPGPATETTPVPAPAESTPTVEAAAVVAPVASAPRPAPRPVAPPAPPEPTLLEQITEFLMVNALFISGGLLVLAGLAAAMVQRRRKGQGRQLSTTISPEMPGSDKSMRGGNIPTAPTDFEELVNAADTYLAFDQPDKAVSELQAALKIMPENPEALIRLCRIAFKRGDRSELGRIAGEIGDVTFKTGAYWEETESMLSKLDKTNDVKVPVKPAVEASDELSMDLERSLMGLASESKNDSVAPTDVKVSNVMDFSMPVNSPVPTPAPTPVPMMDMSFDLPSFDMSPSLAPTPAPAPKAKPALAMDHTETLSLRFDLSLPDDKADFPLASTSETFSLDAPLEANAHESEADSELKTMFELAKAYVDMGDRDGAKELLIEIAQKGSPDIAAQAKKMLTDL